VQGGKLCGKREKEGLVMGMPDVLNSKVFKKFTKGLLVVIGSATVFYYGVIALVLFYCCKCSDNFCESKVCPLIVVLVIPLLVFLTVFLRFACLVKLHYIKLYGSNNSKEGSLLTMHKIEVVSEVCLILAKAIKPDSEKNMGELPTLLKEMVDRLLKMSSDTSVGDINPSNSNTNSYKDNVVGDKYICYVCEAAQKNLT